MGVKRPLRMQSSLYLTVMIALLYNLAKQKLDKKHIFTVQETDVKENEKCFSKTVH